jgi:Sec-independent protein translocase protein TatA
MFDIGPEKLLIIFGAVMLFLGPKEIPAAARTVSKLMRQLRSVQDTLKSELSSVMQIPTDLISGTRLDSQPASSRPAIREPDEYEPDDDYDDVNVDVESREIVDESEPGFGPGPTSFS